MTHLTELTPEECWELMAGEQLARIGWNGSRGPSVLPINYLIRNGTLWIRTGAHSAIAEEVDELQVAVEVDRIEPTSHLGWSVLVRGHAEIVYRVDRVPEDVRALEAWAEGPRPLWVHLTSVEISGRRLEA